MKLLEELGARILSLRREKGLSREVLARRSGMSPRFLAEVELGRGNISMNRLWELTQALETNLASVIGSLPHANQQRKIIALIGLRGAGKTTIGKKLAASLRCRFAELDDLIEKQTGLTLQNVFELHGEDYYRQMEYEVLQQFLQKDFRCVLATGGGLVTREESYELLRRHCRTIWLQADPQDHWDRVLKQDPRPMANYPNAFAQLRKILEQRQPLYSRAEHHINTSTLGIDQSTHRILNQIKNV